MVHISLQSKGLLASDNKGRRQGEDRIQQPSGTLRSTRNFSTIDGSSAERIGSFVGVYYLDDIVHSKTWSEHVEHLRRVLTRIGQAGLTIKLKKCHFEVRECTYLGYRVGHR